MPEVEQEVKQVKADVGEPSKVEEPKKKAFKPVETDQYKEFITLNGAVRRDIK